MAGTRPNVLTIAPGVDFAAHVVKALLGGELFEPARPLSALVLGESLIFVPTRRFARALEDALAAHFGDRPFLIPDIRAMGEREDNEEPPGPDGFRGRGIEASAVQALRSIEPLERAFALRPLIAQWQDKLERHRKEHMTGPGITPAVASARYAESLNLAFDLGRLIDEMHHDGISLAGLAKISPDGFDPARFDDYWVMTRELLALAAREWPEIATHRGGMDASLAQLESLVFLAAQLGREAGDRPVLVVGSTGSVRATAVLMRAVSRLTCGAVVLPGLDQRLDIGDDAGWEYIGHEDASIPSRFAHPQASLKRTLDVIGIKREDIRTLGMADGATSARNALVSEALRPVETVQLWRARRSAMPLDEALAGIGLIEARDEGEEARAAALLIRQTLEFPGKTVLFISADQALASRVEIELTRWGIVARSSVPRSLLDSEAGQLLVLLLKTIEEGSSAAILALLRHPRLRLGYEADDLSALTDALELTVLRGRRFQPEASLSHRNVTAREDRSLRPSPAAQRVSPEQSARIPDVSDALDRCLQPLLQHQAMSLQEAVAILVQTLRSLTMEPSGASWIDTSEDGKRLCDELDRLAVHADDVMVERVALLPVLITVLKPVKTHEQQPTDPRVMILGPLEARLVKADRVILGSANEGSFPPGTGHDPFLNLPMRLALGLQAPDRRIGQSAHDFTMMAGASDFWITRALRSEGQPAMPSRFLRRLEAFAGLSRWDERVRQRGREVLAMVDLLDAPEQIRPAAPPAIIPAEPRIPVRLSITEAETLRRDPYAIYARHLLRLRALDPLDPDLESRDRGNILHAVLDQYSRAYQQLPPAEAMQKLREFGMEAFRPLADQPELFRFWWRDFEALIPDFITFDEAARAEGDVVLTEARAGLDLSLAGGEQLQLVGKIDRIARHADGTFSLFDFKTGEPPGNNEVLSGNAPQLSLSAALLARGGVEAIPRQLSPRALAYYRIGVVNKSRLKAITPKTQTLDEIADQAFTSLKSALEDYASGARAYRSQVRPRKNQGLAGDYDHLARRGEWHISADDPDDEQGEE